MGKSRRNNLAAELEQSEGETDEASNGPVTLQEQDEFSSEGLVMLSARRRSAKVGSDARKRSSRSRTDERNEIGEQIGAQLRTLYDDVLNQPVPDRFLELLNKLETDNISPPRSRTPGER